MLCSCENRVVVRLFVRSLLLSIESEQKTTRTRTTTSSITYLLFFVCHLLACGVVYGNNIGVDAAAAAAAANDDDDDGDVLNVHFA